MRKGTRSDPAFFDPAKARQFYEAGLVDWEIGMHCGVSGGTIAHWRDEHNLPPNGHRHLPGFISPREAYERPPPTPVKVKKEAGRLVKVYQTMYADGYDSQPNVRPKGGK